MSRVFSFFFFLSRDHCFLLFCGEGGRCTAHTYSEFGGNGLLGLAVR